MQKIKFILILLMATLPSINYISYFSSKEEEIVTVLTPILYGVYIFLLVLSVRGFSLLYVKKMRQYYWLLLLVLIDALMIGLVLGNWKMMDDVFSIISCLLAIVIGWSLNLTQKQYYRLLLCFAVVALASGVEKVINQIGGFIILDQALASSKNTFGVILASAGIVFFLLFLYHDKWFIRLVCIAGIIGVAICILTMRARTATFSLVLAVLFIWFTSMKRGKNKRTNILVFCIIAITVIIVLSSDTAWNYILNSFTAGRAQEDFTSGRSERNMAGLAVVLNNPLVANLFDEHNVPWIHNYPLLKLYSYGILFSIPILLIYIKLYIDTIRFIGFRTHDLIHAGLFTMIVPLVVSLGEPTLPFGPGSSVLFCFILFGFSLREALSNKTVTQQYNNN